LAQRPELRDALGESAGRAVWTFDRAVVLDRLAAQITRLCAPATGPRVVVAEAEPVVVRDAKAGVGRP
jgi:hypothetical protein